MKIKNTTKRNIHIRAPHKFKGALPARLVLVAGATQEIEDATWAGFAGSVVDGNIKCGNLVLVEEPKLSKEAQAEADKALEADLRKQMQALKDRQAEEAKQESEVK